MDMQIAALIPTHTLRLYKRKEQQFYPTKSIISEMKIFL